MGVLSCSIFNYNMGEQSQNPVFNLALNPVALLGLIFMPLALVSLLVEPISCHAKNWEKRKFQCTVVKKLFSSPGNFRITWVGTVLVTAVWRNRVLVVLVIPNPVITTQS